MSTTVFAPSGFALHAAYAERAASRTAGVSWEIWWGTAAVLFSVVGMEWDVAWHRSIGRDSFWTPAHVMIQLCGVMTAVVCGYLVLRSTFGNSPVLRDQSIRVWGVRAPLGCFLAVWGGLAMLVSAPFDNWWHSAYGLDVQILSPPHVLLFIGLRMITAGLLVLIAGAMNRAAADRSAGETNFGSLQRLFLFMGGLIVTGHMLLLTAATERPMLHSAKCYRDMAIGVVFMLPLLWQASRHRWAASIAVGVYTVLRIAEVLVFPLFPATPKLGRC